MTNDISLDLSQVIRLADDLAAAPARIIPAVSPAVKRGALRIKKNAVLRIHAVVSTSAALGYARAYPYSISYDLFTSASRVVAEIGPDKDKPQGALGNLLEFGSANNPPYPHLMPAAKEETPRVEAEIAKAALKAMLG